MTIVAVLYGFGFLAGVVAGGLLTVYSRSSARFLLGSWFAFLGIVCYVVGIGLFRGRTWAWAPGVVGYGVTLVTAAVEMRRGHFEDILGIILSLWIILYLNSAGVRLFFDSPRLSFLAVAFGFACLLAFLFTIQTAGL